MVVVVFLRCVGVGCCGAGFGLVASTLIPSLSGSVVAVAVGRAILFFFLLCYIYFSV